jgi:glutamate dehydrogenase
LAAQQAETKMSEAKQGLAPAVLKQIADAFAKGVLPGDLEGFGPVARAAAAEFAGQALALRKSGKAALVIDTLAAADGHRQMRLAAANANMPFLVDSVAAVIAAHGLVTERLLHPVLKVARDAQGRLMALGKEGADESLIYIETERADAKTRTEIRAALEANLGAVRHAVKDWDALKAMIQADAALLADPEEAALLGWIGANHFTLLGHARFARDGSLSAPLGIARTLGPNLLSEAARASAFRAFKDGDAGLIIVKSNLLSPVHRRVPLDLLIIPVRERGKITALSIHTGLWTSAALSAPPEDIPLLRTRLAAH